MKSNLRGLNLTVILFAAVLAAGGCGGGKSQSQDASIDGGDGGVTIPSIDFIQPKDGQVLTTLDSKDPAGEGVKYDVKVGTTGVEVGQLVSYTDSLDIDQGTGNPKIYTAAVSSDGSGGGVAVFENFVFKNGSHQLKAQVANKSGQNASKTIAVTTDDTVSCAITQPVENQELTEADNTQPGSDTFHYNVLVTCHQVETGNDVSLVVNGIVVATQKVQAGQAAFLNAVLAEGSDTLTLQAQNNAGKQAQVTPVHVTVNTGRCLARINAPQDGAVYLENGSGANVIIDADLVAPGMQANLEFETAFSADNLGCTEDSTVTWTITTPYLVIKRSSPVVKDIQNGKYIAVLYETFDPTTLLAGEQISVAASVQENTGANKRNGAALTVKAYVDTVFPSGSITLPTDGTKYNADMNSNPNLPGFHIDVRGVTGRVPEKGKVVLILDRTTTPASVVLGSNPSDLWNSPSAGGFKFKDVAIDPGVHTLTLHVVDGPGNYYESPDITVTINPEVPTVQFIWPTKGQILMGSHDADPSGGLQIDQTSAGPNKFTLQTQNIEEGQIGQLQVGGGGIYRFKVVGNAAVFDYPGGNLDSGKYITLPEGGKIALEAVVKNAAELAAVQVPSDMWVTVDVTPPEIGFIVPQDQDVLVATSTNVELYTTKLENGQEASLTVCDPADSNCSTPVKAAVVGNRASITGLALEQDPTKQPNTLKADASDTAGNPAKTAVIRVTVDTVVPVLGFTKPTNGQTLHQSDNINPDLHDGFAYDVEVEATGVPVGATADLVITDVLSGKAGGPIKSSPSVASTGGVKFVWPATLLPEGQFNLAAVYTRPAGALATAAVDVTVDTGRFRIAVTDPSDGSWLDASKNRDPGSGFFKVDVTAKTNASNGTPCVLTIKNGSTKTVNGNVDATGKVLFGYASVTLDEGPNSLQVHCELGGTFGDSIVATTTVDTKKPSVEFVSPLDGEAFNASSHSTSIDPGFFINVNVKGGTGDEALPDGSPGTLVAKTQSGQENTYSAVFKSNKAIFKKVKISGNNSPVNESATLKLSATDKAGNKSTDLTITVLVDVVPPNITVTEPTKTKLGIADDLDVNTPDLQIEFKATLTGGSVGKQVHLEVTGATTYSAAQGVSSSVSQQFVFPVTLKDGQDNVRIWTDDNAGNVADTGQVSYLVNITAPDIKVFDRNSDVFKEGDKVTWNNSWNTGTGSGFAGDFYFQTMGLLRDSTVSLCSTNAAVGAAQCSLGGGAYRVLGQGAVVTVSGQVYGSVTLNGVPMNEGIHSIFAESQDDFGNKAKSATFEITVDSVPPEVTKIDIDSANPAKIKGNDILLGIAEDADTSTPGMQAAATVTTIGAEDGQAVGLFDNTSALLGTATVAGGKAVFSKTAGNLVTLAEGTHKLTAEVSDKAGNESESSPTVSIISYIKAPYTAFYNPAEYKSGAWLTQTECAAKPVYVCSINGTLFSLNAAVNYSHESPAALLGSKITLTGGLASQVDYPITGYAGGQATATFVGFQLKQGANNLSASLSDVVENTFTTTREVDVDTAAPNVAFVQPNTPDPDNPRVFTAADNKNPDPSNGLATDQFIVSVTGVDGATDVYIEARQKGSGGAFAPILNGHAVLSADNTNLAFNTSPYPTLNQGDWELRVRSVDLRSNASVSGSIYVKVDISVPIVSIQKAGGAVLTTGGKFTAADMTSGPVPFITTVVVASDQEGQNARLWVNDVEQPAVQIVSGKAAFAGVTLKHYVPGDPNCFNKLKAEVKHAVSGYTTTVELTGIAAEGTVPTMSFTYPLTLGDPSNPGKMYKVGNDKDNNGKNGLQFKTTPEDETIRISTSGVEDGQQAVLSCTAGAVVRTDTSAVSGNKTVFDFGFTEDPSKALVTAHQMYVCTVEVTDFVGNKAVSPTLYIWVDVLPPANTKPAGCIGETTGTGAGESEDGACAAVCVKTGCSPAAYDEAACTCSRRRGVATVLWSAAGEDDTGGGKVKQYEVRWDEDASVGHDCSAFNWDTAKTSGITPGAIVDPGLSQTAVVRGLNPQKYYCFAVKSWDSVDNASTTGAAYAAVRRFAFIQEKVADGEGGFYGGNGFNVAGNCDFNGDGYADITVGAANLGSNSGAVYVYYGNNAVSNIKLGGPGSNSFFGWSVGCGDFNGDGYDDLLATAPLYSYTCGTKTCSGAAYVYFGSSTGLKSSPDLTIKAKATEPVTPFALLGARVSRAKLDINGDKNGQNRLDDIAFMARDMTDPANIIDNVIVFKGRANWTGVTLDPDSPDVKFSPPAATGLGSLSTADVDGDGYDDLVVGVNTVNSTGKGAMYVVFGKADISGSITPASAGVITKAGDSAGYGFLAAAGDVNSDNAGDVFVLNSDTSNIFAYAGRSGKQDDIDSKGSFSATGSSQFGFSMGFFQFDGVHNGLIVGSSGNVYLYYNATMTFTGSNYLAKIAGGSGFGAGVDGGGDWNKDGFEDFAVCDSAGNGALYIYK